MSQPKRTAFAREPRGTGTSARQPGKLVINKQFLDKMADARLAPDLNTVLTKTNGELVTRTSSGGKSQYSIIAYGGAILGDAADVTKVQTLGSFINEERKIVLKTSVSQKTKGTFAGMVRISQDDNRPRHIVERPITKFPKGFVDIFRTVKNQMDIMAKNVSSIQAVQIDAGPNETIRNHMVETASRIRVATGKFLFHRASLPEGDKGLKLNEFLRSELVLTWVFNRLTSQKILVQGQDFEFRRMYFPKDPTKGLAVTFEEFQNVAMLNNQGGVIKAMQGMQWLFEDDFLRLVCNIPIDWDLEDFSEGSPSRVLAKVPILVPPFHLAVSVKEVISAIGRTNDRGMPWQVGNTVSPQDNLKFLGTIPKKLFYGLVPRPLVKVELIEGIFPGFRFAKDNQEIRSVYAQLSQWAKTNEPNQSWVNALRLKSARSEQQTSLIIRTVRAIMDFEVDSDIQTEITTNLSSNEIVIPAGNNTDEYDAWVSIQNLANSLSGKTVSEILAGKLDRDLEPKAKGVKGNVIQTARSRLGEAGKRLVQKLRDEKFVEVSQRVDQWLRSFLTIDLQTPVAEIVLARLDASLANPVQFDGSDSIGFLDAVRFSDDVLDDRSDADDQDGQGNERTAEVPENPDE
jgi:hypothetical protein